MGVRNREAGISQKEDRKGEGRIGRPLYLLAQHPVERFPTQPFPGQGESGAEADILAKLSTKLGKTIITFLFGEKNHCSAPKEKKQRHMPTVNTVRGHAQRRGLCHNR